MAADDFDLEGLAQYLHLQPAVVQRMAERGSLPGRRIGGQWKFSQAEIHHWFEDRIGVSDEEQLRDVEGVLERQYPQEEIRLIDLVPAEAVEPALAAKTRAAVIDAMVEVAARSGSLWDPPRMADAVRARESLHPTALDSGVALMHPRRPLPNILAEPILAIGKTSHGIPFGGPHGSMTDVFLLICSVTDAAHLRTLARLSRLLARPSFLFDLRDAETSSEMLDVLRREEEQLTA